MRTKRTRTRITGPIINCEYRRPGGQVQPKDNKKPFMESPLVMLISAIAPSRGRPAAYQPTVICIYANQLPTLLLLLLLLPSPPPAPLVADSVQVSKQKLQIKIKANGRHLLMPGDNRFIQVDKYQSQFA